MNGFKFLFATILTMFVVTGLAYGQQDTTLTITSNGNVGIGTTGPGEALHIDSGNILINSENEQEIRIRRTGIIGSGDFARENPAFRLGRIIGAGDGSPAFRVLYSDDGPNESTQEVPVFVFDNKGIVASVKQTVGSHFEGFIHEEAQPLFRLNSFPAMQLEFGPGGNTETDVIIRRANANTLTILTGGNERLRIDSSGNVGIGTTDPQGTLDVNGSIFQRGALLHADYVFEPDYQLESIEEHAEFMWKHKHLKAIPKAKVDAKGREIVEVGAHRKGIVEELEKAHIYIEQLHKRIKIMEVRLAKLETVVNSEK